MGLVETKFDEKMKVSSDTKPKARLQRRRRKAERINAAVRHAEYYTHFSPKEMFEIFLELMERTEILSNAKIIEFA